MNNEPSTELFNLKDFVAYTPQITQLRGAFDPFTVIFQLDRIRSVNGTKILVDT